MRSFDATAAALTALALANAFAVPHSAAADRALGEYLSSECVTCHRADGQNKGIPSIVGWRRDEFVAALQEYKSKGRANPVMQTIAGRLTMDEMQALAAYYESLRSR